MTKRPLATRACVLATVATSKVGVGVIVSKSASKPKKSAGANRVAGRSDRDDGAAAPRCQPQPTPAVGSALPQSSPLRWLGQGVAFVFTATLAAAVGAGVMMVAPLSAWLPNSTPESRGGLADLLHNSFQYRLTRPVNILVMGIDRVPGAPDNSPEIFSGRSDTMLLLRLDPGQKAVSLLSIPRDTRVEVPGVGFTKINDANVTGGPALAAHVVSQNLNQTPIDRYVRVSTEAFRELVDQVGGVQVFVPFAMTYVDHTQHLNINLGQGWQLLNGDQAEQFARFRHDGYGDIGRVQRQQALLKALRQRLTDPTVLPRLPGVIQVMQKYIDTNLSLEEILTLVQFGMNLEPSHIKMVMLPGQFSTPDQYAASYWLLNPIGRDRVLREYFQTPTSSPTTEATDSESAPSTLNIAIQNASSQPGLGRRLAQYLQAKGFYHVYVVEDWPEPLNQTQIIVQQGDITGANALQKFLGLGQIEAASTGDIESDLTIRVGNDWVTPSTVSP
ncbi:LCP family protein [Neosynechococcus sphagnicola]|uniref:LCP family protein n=1 Tax=Neosynechococcus sphagnicola TaxID=1501145 RepID=UPI0006895E6B|nr:LCP family protein [Neosynechococcus sphagnicola]